MHRLLLTALAVAAIGCGGPATTPQRAPLRTAPPGWMMATTRDGTIQLALPPWLVVFGNSDAIYANEPPPGPGEEFPMQLMAVGPRNGEQPAAGQDLASWIERRFEAPGQGIASVTRVTLPLGPAIRYDRTDRAGTPTAWRIVAYAIETPAGVALLVLDGPPGAWAARAADLEWVAHLFRVR